MLFFVLARWLEKKFGYTQGWLFQKATTLQEPDLFQKNADSDLSKDNG